MEMRTNMGLVDRTFRILLAIPGLLVYILGNLGTVSEFILVSISGLLLWTGTFAFCPLYMILGLRSDGKA